MIRNSLVLLLIVLPLALLAQQREWATMLHTQNSHDQRMSNIAISSAGDMFTVGFATPTAYLGDSLIEGIYHNRHGIILHLDGQNGQLKNYRRVVTDSFAIGSTLHSVYIDEMDNIYATSANNVDSFKVEGFPIPTYFQHLPEGFFGDIKYFISYNYKLEPINAFIPIASDIIHANLIFKDSSFHLLELQWRYFTKINGDSLFASEDNMNILLIKYQEWNNVVQYRNVAIKDTRHKLIGTKYDKSENLIFSFNCDSCEIESTYNFEKTIVLGSIPLDSALPLSWIKGYPYLDRFEVVYPHVDDQDNIYFFAKIQNEFQFAGKPQAKGYALFSLDKNGNERWAVHFGNNSHRRTDNLRVEGNNIYLGGGLNSGIELGNVKVNRSNEDVHSAFLVKLNSNGEAIWGIEVFDESLGLSSVHSVYSSKGDVFLITKTNDFIFNGTEMKRKDFDGKLPMNVHTFVKIKDLSYEPVGEENINKADELINIYPNPNNGSFTIDFVQPNQTNNIQVNVMDIQGKKCYSKNLPIKDQTAVQLALDVPPGMYIVRIQNEKINAVKKIIVQ